jgi:hypothetical protein
MPKMRIHNREEWWLQPYDMVLSSRCAELNALTDVEQCAAENASTNFAGYAWVHGTSMEQVGTTATDMKRRAVLKHAINKQSRGHR